MTKSIDNANVQRFFRGVENIVLPLPIGVVQRFVLLPRLMPIAIKITNQLQQRYYPMSAVRCRL